jgi:hypothetical protein
MLVLLADVILLAEVDEEDDRLGRKEEERVDDLDLENRKHVLMIRIQFFEGEIGVWSQRRTSFHKDPALRGHQRAGIIEHSLFVIFRGRGVGA